VDIGLDRALPVQGKAEGVDDPSDQGRPGRNFHDPVGPADQVAFADEMAFAQQDGADAVLLQVQGQAEDIAGKSQELVGHDPVQAVNAGDPVPDRDDRPDLPDIDLHLQALDPALDDFADFVRFNVHDHRYPSRICARSRSRLPLSDAS
jgi:hypothetical protein